MRERGSNAKQRKWQENQERRVAEERLQRQGTARLMSAASPSPQREQFDSALRVLLIKENLDGTRWVIDQLRTEPIAAAFGHEAARIALWLESNLDKRTAQLTIRD